MSLFTPVPKPVDQKKEETKQTQMCTKQTSTECCLKKEFQELKNKVLDFEKKLDSIQSQQCPLNKTSNQFTPLKR